VLDVEHKTPGLSDEQFRDSVLKWLDIVEQHYQVKPIIYTYYKFKTQYLGDSVFNQYPYWIAHYYVDEVEYDGPWMFWQHTDAGRLPGISGMVDLNIFKGSLNDLMDLCIKREE
jgi:lysozyme